LLRQKLLTSAAKWFASNATRGREKRRFQRLVRDFFLAVVPGIILFMAFRVDLAVEAAAFFTVRTACETADFFFAFLAIVISSS
jgi:hypothetical protein